MKCKVSSTTSQGSNYHASEILVIHNGTTAYESQYGIIITNGSLYDVSVSLSSGSVKLSVTPSSSSTVFSGRTVDKVKFLIVTHWRV